MGSIARGGLEKMPGNPELEALQEEARALYKANKPAPEASTPSGPTITKDQAKEVLDSSLQICFEHPENYARLKAAVSECFGGIDDPMARAAALQAKLIPLVFEMIGGL